jgi:hypothetical protein
MHAINLRRARSATGRWFGDDMGERFIPGATQAAQHVNNNTITRTDKRASA